MYSPPWLYFKSRTRAPIMFNQRRSDDSLFVWVRRRKIRVPKNSKDKDKDRGKKVRMRMNLNQRFISRQGKKRKGSNDIK